MSKMVQSLDATPPTVDEAKELLAALRWQKDMLVTNPFGERVWLKPCIVDGVRYGITDCCSEDEPCERHQAMAAR
jgi:hypothetical protein